MNTFAAAAANKSEAPQRLSQGSTSMSNRTNILLISL